MALAGDRGALIGPGRRTCSRRAQPDGTSPRSLRPCTVGAPSSVSARLCGKARSDLRSIVATPSATATLSSLDMGAPQEIPGAAFVSARRYDQVEDRRSL